MVDVVGAMVAGAMCAVQAGVLIGFSAQRMSAKLAGFAAAALWGGSMVAIGALGGFAPGVTGPVPAPVLAFCMLLAVLFGGWFLLPGFRTALLSVPLPALIGLNGMRLGGVFFLLLLADGRLAAPFAPVAAWGDIAVAALAIPLAVMAAVFPGERVRWFAAWNALGALDLAVAVTLGVLSVPGTPFRFFMEEPGSLAMATLPWVMVPAMLVPVYLLVHLVIAAKIGSPQPSAQQIAAAH